MKFLPAGAGALLVEQANLEQVLALFASLQRHPIAGIEEIIPAARTLFVRFKPWVISMDALQHVLRTRTARVDAGLPTTGETVEIPVHYDGEDLDAVAKWLEISTDEVIARHTGSPYQVAFMGFAPGFAYLFGAHSGLDVPRRTTPRTQVPAGSVALAGTLSAVYPTQTPGGWQLLGHTRIPMWDSHATPPARLQPGMQVQFVRARQTHYSIPATAEKRDQSLSSPGAVSVVASGLRTLFQDAGRPLQAQQGVQMAGAMDQGARCRANYLLGNAADAVVLEALGSGLQLAVHAPVEIAVTGGEGVLEVTDPAHNSHTLPMNRALALDAGDTLTLGTLQTGMYRYVAIRGGFKAEQVLASASTDTLAKLGPKPLCTGQGLFLADAVETTVQPADKASPVLPSAQEVTYLDIEPGPRMDWFAPAALNIFTEQAYSVTSASDRVGLRLHADQPLKRQRQGELASEGLALGAIQVPPSGQPVLFLADRPLTGGYPVMACVAPHHLDLAAQMPPGAQIRFRWVDGALTLKGQQT